MSADDLSMSDLPAAADLTTFDFTGTACGQMTCNPTTQECCLMLGSGAPVAMCVATGTCNRDAGAVVGCDGPEDCTGGNNCCATIDVGGPGDAGSGSGSGSAMCSMGCQMGSANFGGGSFSFTSKLCHAPSDCAGYSGGAAGPFDACCSSPQSGPYRFCAPPLLSGQMGITCL